MKFSALLIILYPTAHAASILPNSKAEDLLSTSTCLTYSCKRIKSIGIKDIESIGTIDTFKFSNSVVEIYYAERRRDESRYVDFIEISFNYSKSPNSANEVCSILKTIMINSQYINGNFCKSLVTRPDKYGSVQVFRFRLAGNGAVYAFNTISNTKNMKISINRIPDSN